MRVPWRKMGYVNVSGKAQTWTPAIVSATTKLHLHVRFTENVNLRLRLGLLQDWTQQLPTKHEIQVVSKNVLCLGLLLDFMVVVTLVSWLVTANCGFLSSENSNTCTYTMFWKKQSSSGVLLLQTELYSKPTFHFNCCVLPSVTYLEACLREWDILQISQQCSYWDSFLQDLPCTWQLSETF